jgi:hypothetical protein
MAYGLEGLVGAGMQAGGRQADFLNAGLRILKHFSFASICHCFFSSIFFNFHFHHSVKCREQIFFSRNKISKLMCT